MSGILDAIGGFTNSLFGGITAPFTGSGELDSKHRAGILVISILVTAIVTAIIVVIVLYMYNKSGFSARRQPGASGCYNRLQSVRAQEIEPLFSQYDMDRQVMEMTDATGSPPIRTYYDGNLPDNVRYSFTSKTAAPHNEGYSAHEKMYSTDALVQQKMPPSNFLTPNWGESDMLNLINS